MKPAHQELMRRLTLADEHTLRAVMAGRPPLAETLLDDRVGALVCLAGLIAVGGVASSFRSLVDAAQAAGVDDDATVGVLATIAPIVGSARIDGAVPMILAALGDGSFVADDHRRAPRGARSP